MDLAGEFTLAADDRPDQTIQLRPQPILRYSNPVRDSLSDGATFLWLEGDCPVAVGALSIRGDGRVYREFTSLVNRPLQCTHDSGSIWSPMDGGMLREDFPDSPPVAGSRTQRLTQMRRLARRFTGAYLHPDSGEASNLRLLTQPVYRYADDAAAIVDAAFFGFVEANDPELLLIIEAVVADPDNGTLKWRYSLARMTSVTLNVQLDGREVWTVENFWRNPRTASDAYVEARVGQYEDLVQIESGDE